MRERDFCILGMAGVGSASDATGARRSLTFSSSRSSVFPSEMSDMFFDDFGGGELVFKWAFFVWRKRGDS